MSALRDVLPEVQFALLFPNQPLPSWALEKMVRLEEYRFNLRGWQKEVVPLARVIGTSSARYGDAYRWLDMLTIARGSHNFEVSNWPGFLDADTSDIELVRLAGTNDYFILGEGNHRLTAFKLAGRPTITCPVAVAHPNPDFQEIPIRSGR